MKHGESGLRKLQEAYDFYNAQPGNPAKASGVILHRKDQIVADGTYKWVPCIWKFEGNNALTLTPVDTIAQEAAAFPIQSNTQYKKPKSKHYPLQFGMRTPVYTSVLLETVVYEATGYANSPLDPITKPGTTAIQAVCKIASLDMKELEKLLFCVQAVVDGKPPGAYLNLGP
jgi:hypothetical protein